MKRRIFNIMWVLSLVWAVVISINIFIENNVFFDPNPKDWSSVQNAYLTGQMNDEQQTTYLNALKSGEIPTPPAPQSIYDAYTSGQMNDEQKAQFDQAVNDGIWTIPERPISIIDRMLKNFDKISFLVFLTMLPLIVTGILQYTIRRE